MRHGQKKALQELGVTDIVEAGDGMQAIAQVAKARPDLILMDWSLPKLNGILALRMIKKDLFNRDLPVFITHVEADKEHILVAAQAGAVGYLIKPLTVAVLREKLAAWLPGKTET